MAEETSYDVPFFGLRDILMYLIPGTIALASVVLFLSLLSGILTGLVSQLGRFGISVASIFVAYFIGHAIYPLNYPLRGALDRSSLVGPIAMLEDCAEFRTAFHSLIENHGGFYAAEVSRCRSLARFASAMFLPSILFGFAVGCCLRPHGLWLLMLPVALGVLAAYGFALRYKRYQARFYDYVLCCYHCDWTLRCTSGKSTNTDHSTEKPG